MQLNYTIRVDWNIKNLIWTICFNFKWKSLKMNFLFVSSKLFFPKMFFFFQIFPSLFLFYFSNWTRVLVLLNDSSLVCTYHWFLLKTKRKLDGKQWGRDFKNIYWFSEFSYDYHLILFSMLKHISCNYHVSSSLFKEYFLPWLIIMFSSSIFKEYFLWWLITLNDN